MIDNYQLKSIENDAIERYSNRFSKLGVSPKTLGWGSRENQLERFKVILENCELNNKTILDIGCGFGDFYEFLKDRNIEVKYIGVDINSDFIDHCKSKFPEAIFIQMNIMLEEKIDIEPDIVVSLGTLNFKLKDEMNIEYSKKFIKKSFNIAKEKLIVDFLSEYVTAEYPKEDFVFYHSPIEILKFGMDLSNNIKLIHDYKPIPQTEFMMIVGK